MSDDVTQIKVGSIVRISSIHIGAWVGPVISSYATTVYEGDFDKGEHKPIGEEPAGIEMYDIRRAQQITKVGRTEDKISYYYWKEGDPLGPFTVEVYDHNWPGTWNQVYPRTIGGWTFDERNNSV
jgi:hypothetical protein